MCYQSGGEPDAEKPHVRICEGLGRVISLVYSPRKCLSEKVLGTEVTVSELQNMFVDTCEKIIEIMYGAFKEKGEKCLI